MINLFYHIFNKLIILYIVTIIEKSVSYESTLTANSSRINVLKLWSVIIMSSYKISRRPGSAWKSSLRMITFVLTITLLSLVGTSCLAAPTAAPTSVTTKPSVSSTPLSENVREIYLAGGCFWGVEAYMDRIDGVIDAISGYANGKTGNPSYEDVIYRGSGHAETVKVSYDASLISLDELLIYYFAIIDPTSLDKQGNDIGTQYRTGIYYVDPDDRQVIDRRIQNEQKSHSKPIVVEVEPLVHFYDAEDYHQDYLDKNPTGYCHIDLSLAFVYVIRVSDYPKPPIEDIRAMLTPLQFSVTQENATEAPYSNLYNDNYVDGIYVDIVTGEPLFSSSDKFRSGTGWPSFTRPIASYVITYHEDDSLGVMRTEVRSRSGDSHLGHVFEDGPIEAGGLRYCINSAALRFIPLDDMAAEGYSELISWIS